MGPNTTGLPRTEDYMLGRGKLYFAALDANGLPTAYRDLGNAPEFKLSIEVETLEHKSSRSGLKVTDKEVVISQKCTLNFTLDEVNDENLANLFSGEKTTHTNVAVAGFASHELVAAGTIVPGAWYDIRNSTGERAYGIAADKLTLATTNTTPVTLVKDTDYTLDLEMGRFRLLASDTINAAVTATEGITAVLTADATARAVYEVQALTKTALLGALKFVAENPVDGDRQQEFQFHQVNLKANGDFSAIGDDWTQMSFKAVAERNLKADSASPTLTIRSVAAAA